jgi:hypothetical protein
MNKFDWIELIEQMDRIHEDIMTNGPYCTCNGDEWCIDCGKSQKLSSLAATAIRMIEEDTTVSIEELTRMEKLESELKWWLNFRARASSTEITERWIAGRTLIEDSKTS